jgi:hypothetical protein
MERVILVSPKFGISQIAGLRNSVVSLNILHCQIEGLRNSVVSMNTHSTARLQDYLRVW